MIRDKKKVDLDVFDAYFAANLQESKAYKPGRIVILNAHMELYLMKYVQGYSFQQLKDDYLVLIQFILATKRNLISEGLEYPSGFNKEIYCLMAFAIAFNLDSKQWSILTKDIFEPAGGDWVLDQLIAQRSLDRKIADFSSWKQTPFGGYFYSLHDVIELTGEEQQIAILNHLKKWHSNRNHGSFRMRFGYGADPAPGKIYIAQFAFELAAVVMAFDIDDSAFCDDIYYPKELVDYWRENKALKSQSE